MINLPVGIVTVMLGRRWLIESRDPTSPVPAPLGVALSLAGSVLLTLGLVRAKTGWTSPTTLGVISLASPCCLPSSVTGSHRRADDRPLAVRDPQLRLGQPGDDRVELRSYMFLSSILFLTDVWQWSILKATGGGARTADVVLRRSWAASPPASASDRCCCGGVVLRWERCGAS